MADRLYWTRSVPVEAERTQHWHRVVRNIVSLQFFGDQSFWVLIPLPSSLQLAVILGVFHTLASDSIALHRFQVGH